MNYIDNKMARHGEKGNVLFLILIAVALFAALSYAVTQSTRTGGGDTAGETTLISSAQLTQYPASVRTAVVRMILKGKDVTDLEFNPASAFSSCTASNSFCVFHPSGGGATFATAPTGMMASTGGNTTGEWVYNMENEIELLGTTNNGTTVSVATADLIAFLPGITQTLCNKVNSELGIAGVTAPTETGLDISTYMDNTYTAGTNGSVIDAAGSSDALVGQPFGCFVDTGVYTYFHVLVER